LTIGLAALMFPTQGTIFSGAVITGNKQFKKIKHAFYILKNLAEICRKHIPSCSWPSGMDLIGGHADEHAC